MNIVTNIDRYCNLNGITVKAFERKCKLSNSIVHKWRLGLATPSLKTLNRIAEFTGIATEEWLKGGQDDNSFRQNQGEICGTPC